MDDVINIVLATVSRTRHRKDGHQERLLVGCSSDAEMRDGKSLANPFLFLCVVCFGLPRSLSLSQACMPVDFCRERRGFNIFLQN